MFFGNTVHNRRFTGIYLWIKCGVLKWPSERRRHDWQLSVNGILLVSKYRITFRRLNATSSTSRRVCFHRASTTDIFACNNRGGSLENHVHCQRPSPKIILPFNFYKKIVFKLHIFYWFFFLVLRRRLLALNEKNKKPEIKLRQLEITNHFVRKQFSSFFKCFERLLKNMFTKKENTIIWLIYIFFFQTCLGFFNYICTNFYACLSVLWSLYLRETWPGVH